MTEIATPAPGPGEVLIRIRATSVNPVEWKIREGGLARLFPCQFPLILGWDAAGTIAALGDGVTGLSIGDRVWSYCRKPDIQWGTYAEYVTMAADCVAPMPANLSFAEASTIPLVGLTSWQSLFDVAAIRPGQTVLIHAGAGGRGGDLGHGHGLGPAECVDHHGFHRPYPASRSLNLCTLPVAVRGMVSRKRTVRGHLKIASLARSDSMMRVSRSGSCSPISATA